MLSKPSECKGCPLYGDGMGFVPDEIRDAAVTILAQNPGEFEEQGRKVTVKIGKTWQWEPHPPAPLIGPTGWELERSYLPAAGLTRDEVSLCNVLRCRLIVNGRRTNDLPPPKILDAAIKHCSAAYLKIPTSTKLVVAMGALSWRTLGGPGTITDWRGYALQGPRES